MCRVFLPVRAEMNIKRKKPYMSAPLEYMSPFKGDILSHHPNIKEVKLKDKKKP